MPEPLSLNVPRTTQAFENKYNKYPELYQSLDPRHRAALIALDQEKAARGQNPLSIRQSRNVGMTVKTGEPYTKPPKRSGLGGIYQNIVSDVGTIGKSVIRLPWALAEEVRDLPQMQEEVSAALNSGGQPWDVVSKVAQAPGVRMFPGAFIAANLPTPGELYRHPVFTALDITPAGKIPAVKGGLKKVGEATAPARAEALRLGKKTTLGRTMYETFGKEARDISERWNYGIRKNVETVYPVKKLKGEDVYAPIDPNNPIAGFARSAYQMQQKYPTIGETRRKELTTLMEVNSPEISSLSGEELAFVKDSRSIIDGFNEYAVTRGALKEIDGELFTPKQAGQIDAARKRAQKADEAFYETPTERNWAKYQRAEAKRKALEARTVPNRFGPLLQRQLQDRVEVMLTDHPDFDTLLPYLQERNYGWLKKEGYMTEAELGAIKTDLKTTWQDLRAAGHDPIFVAHASPTRINSMRYPRILERDIRPQQVRENLWNASPGVDDMSVALPFTAMEFLEQRGSEAFIVEMLEAADTFKEVDLIQRYLPAARMMTDDPLQHLTIANDLMREEYSIYNPKDIITWPSAVIDRYKGQAIWMPKSKINTIKRLHQPPMPKLTAFFDPVMKVFRTALLPLSPRWQMNNMVSGGIMLGSRTGPSVIKYMKQAYDMVRSGQLPDELPRGFASIPGNMVEWNTRPVESRLAALYHYKGGQTIRRIHDEVQESKAGAVGTKAKEGFAKVVEKSYAFNEFFDSMYRTMAYLYGENKSLKQSAMDPTITEGMTAHKAQTAGVELARKTMQNWDRMTPIERSIMRTVFPFYGWMSHIIKFMAQYPADHPIRASVVAAFARNELEDNKDALPERFLNMFMLGDMDENGDVTALNMGGMNPFADASNYFTLAGFMGQTNPAITTLMQSLGIDPMTGGTELFPTLKYDPELGRLSTEQGNLLSNAVGNVIPQSKILTGFLDKQSEFQALLRTNPDAAGRYLISAAGLPVLIRDVNMPQEYAKAEIARDEAQRDSLSESLKAGDWSAAQKFPGLETVLEDIRQKQAAGEIEQYQMTPGVSAIVAGQEALKRTFSPSGIRLPGT